MNGERIFLQEADLEQFQMDGSCKNLLSSVQGLIIHQIKNWPELAEARNQLQTIQTRNVFLNSLEVTLQFNPGRIVSARAPVDSESVRTRPCFLCIENLPPLQRALLYQEEWLILNNPAPLFHDHLVISHKQHTPQSINQALQAMIQLITDLAFRFQAFYNGPACGASAPDHLHFQICPNGHIPLVSQVISLLHTDNHKGLLRSVDTGTDTYAATAYLDHRLLFICRAISPEVLQRQLAQVIDYLRIAGDCQDEPMVNLIIAGNGEDYYGIVFPRKAHRPACYFREGSKRILVSPGAVDMGGLVILPRKEDYECIDRNILLNIFNDVCHGPEMFAKLTLQ